MRARGTIRIVAGLLCLLPLGACERDEPERVAAPPAGGPVAGVPGEVHINPGPAYAHQMAVQNPYADDPRAVNEGERFYGWYNCGGCHGELGGGGMGPPLRDEDWIYGGDAVSIYESIMEGRPEGMPTWQGKIPEDQAWKIVAFIQTLGTDREPEPSLTPPEGRVPGGGSSADGGNSSGGQ